MCSPARTPTPGPCSTRLEDGFRTPAEATDEDVRLAQRYQGYGGTRFVEDDLAGDPEAGALGPPSITDRPPQIIGRPSDVERLLDEAGQRAQEVERSAAQAVEETAAVAAEEGEVAVAAEGVGGAFGYLGGLAEGAAALTPAVGEVAGTLAGAAGVGAAATGLAVGLAGGAATASHAARAGCWRTRSSGPSRAARTRPCRTSGPPTT